MRQKSGRIVTLGKAFELTFEPVEGVLNDRADDAYRAKYHDSSYLKTMISLRARGATVKVMPRGIQQP